MRSSIEQLLSEERVSLAEAGEVLGVGQSQVYRYIREGMRGVVLDSVRAPRTWTTREACHRFQAELDATYRDPVKDAKARKERRDTVRANLEKAGL